MYYPSYEDYMRDVFYFNGLSCPTQNFGFMQNNIQNLNSMYPSIYKIVYPVIQRVVSGNNYQFLNDDTVNNIVDVVIGITAGDIGNMEANIDSKRNCQQGNNSQNQNMSSNSQNNMNSGKEETSPLLKDLIKILTIRELISKSNVRSFPYGLEPRNATYFNNQALPF